MDNRSCRARGLGVGGVPVLQAAKHRAGGGWVGVGGKGNTALSRPWASAALFSTRTFRMDVQVGGLTIQWNAMGCRCRQHQA